VVGLRSVARISRQGGEKVDYPILLGLWRSFGLAPRAAYSDHARLESLPQFGAITGDLLSNASY
jgi:hypothetical protein